MNALLTGAAGFVGSNLSDRLIDAGHRVTGVDNLITGRLATVVHAPFPEDDPVRRRPDISLARSVLGWSPSVPLRQGLDATIRYFAAQERRPQAVLDAAALDTRAVANSASGRRGRGA
jgi:nucleoside-diphosphate-sugar epimerase